VATAAAAELYWVQVGVFRDGEAAKRVAQRLRERKYRVHESIVQQRSGTPLTAAAAAVPTRGTDTRYELVVSGGASSEVAARVATKGLSGRPSPEGVVITPSLPLSEAVALSRDLADDGLAVRVRRVGAAAPPAPRAEDIQAGAASGADTLHRVRVGGFADRAAAEAVLRELEALGDKPFLARASE
jgi:SPOR domain